MRVAAGTVRIVLRLRATNQIAVARLLGSVEVTAIAAATVTHRVTVNIGGVHGRGATALKSVLFQEVVHHPENQSLQSKSMRVKLDLIVSVFICILTLPSSPLKTIHSI